MAPFISLFCVFFISEFNTYLLTAVSNAMSKVSSNIVVFIVVNFHTPAGIVLSGISSQKVSLLYCVIPVSGPVVEFI